MLSLPPEQMALRLLLAAVLGALVGLERERLDRGAGLRTHALTALGACLCMLVSTYGFAEALNPPKAALDPSRLAAQVVSGVGFLCAGTIMMRRHAIRGLTTAASLWSVAGIGLAVGGGMHVAAVVTTLLMLGILLGLKPIENLMFPNHRRHRLHLQCERRPGVVSGIEAALQEAEIVLDTLTVHPGSEGAPDRIEVAVRHTERGRLLSALEQLRAIPGVTRAAVDSVSDDAGEEFLPD